MQKWQTSDVENITSEKAKHINIDVGGTTPVNLHFHAGSKDNVEAIMAKLKSSKALSKVSNAPGPSTTVASHSPPPSARANKKPSVHFSHESPDIIPRGDDEVDGEEGEEVEEQDEGSSDQPATNGHDVPQGSGTALYDFIADAHDELSIVEGEQLIILKREDEWWKVRNSKGVQGVVPGSYIEVSNSSWIYVSPMA